MEQANTAIAHEAASTREQTERALVDEVARTALDVRRVNNRLKAFNAGPRASNALSVPLTLFNDAVERLAAFRGLK